MNLLRLPGQHRRLRRKRRAPVEPREIFRGFVRVLESLCHRPPAPRRSDKGSR